MRRISSAFSVSWRTADPPRLNHSSQCAFVNLSSEAHLQHTITQSHGILLRPDDPKCKPLVCRVRRVEDDAKSGVGAQRGGGLHKAWVELHNQEEVKRKSLELGVEVEEVRKEMGSADTTSTDSDFFEAHFPKVRVRGGCVLCRAKADLRPF